MKAHLAKVSLALLSVAFLLGCQEQGSEPVGPEGLEIQAKQTGKGEGKGKGGGSGGRDTAFDVSFDGDLIGMGTLFGVHGGKKGLQTEFQKLGDLTLTLDFLGKIDNSTPCFGAPTEGQQFKAIMQVGLKTPKDTENATMGFWFTAKGTDGSSDANYLLSVDGPITGAEWPDVDGTGTGTTIEADRFTLGHSSGSGSDVACTGAGTVAVTILVTRSTS